MSLRELIEAVEAGKRVTIPTPHWNAKLTSPDTTARIMGYVEGYVVMRHKGAAPFIMTVKDVLRAMEARDVKGECNE